MCWSRASKETCTVQTPTQETYSDADVSDFIYTLDNAGHNYQDVPFETERNQEFHHSNWKSNHLLAHSRVQDFGIQPEGTSKDVHNNQRHSLTVLGQYRTHVRYQQHKAWLNLLVTSAGPGRLGVLKIQLPLSVDQPSPPEGIKRTINILPIHRYFTFQCLNLKMARVKWFFKSTKLKIRLPKFV